MKIAEGTTPAGARSQQEAAAWVRGMFGRVAPRYDLLNHLLSFHIDRYWRAVTVRRVAHILDCPGVRALDLCCGTGDLTLALQKRASYKQTPRLVFGSDFCHPMLTAAAEKSARRGARTSLFEADAMRLPLADASFDLLTVAFGFRNLADYDAGLREMRRLLKPGGIAAILEFTTPPNALMRAANDFYSGRVLPVIGGWISGSRDAYSYLPESIRKFPNADALAEKMHRAGFDEVSFEYMTGGMVALHLGRVEALSGQRSAIS
jgi:demethylmenaquinone methyltransferase/2-methoxy-6-polyprenyl-1,4-benzoquinol methylase